jgi:hypothetical protein
MSSNALGTSTRMPESHCSGTRRHGTQSGGTRPLCPDDQADSVPVGCRVRPILLSTGQDCMVQSCARVAVVSNNVPTRSPMTAQPTAHSIVSGLYRLVSVRGLGISNCHTGLPATARRLILPRKVAGCAPAVGVSTGQTSPGRLRLSDRVRHLRHPNGAPASAQRLPAILRCPRDSRPKRVPGMRPLGRGRSPWDRSRAAGQRAEGSPVRPAERAAA